MGCVVRVIQDLISELKSELSSNFEQAVLAMFMTPAEYDAEQLRSAMKVWCGPSSVIVASLNLSPTNRALFVNKHVTLAFFLCIYHRFSIDFVDVVNSA